MLHVANESRKSQRSEGKQVIPEHGVATLTWATRLLRSGSYGRARAGGGGGGRGSGAGVRWGSEREMLTRGWAVLQALRGRWGDEPGHGPQSCSRRDRWLKEQGWEVVHTALLSQGKINLQLKYFLHMPVASSHSNRPYGFHQTDNAWKIPLVSRGLVAPLLILEAGRWARSELGLDSSASNHFRFFLKKI